MSIQYDLSLFFFKFSTSLPKNFIIKEIGVIIKKKTTAITIGAKKLPMNNPNLNQSLLKGVKIVEFFNPNIKKNILMIKDQTLILSLLISG